jgi:hypothetical protein
MTSLRFQVVPLKNKFLGKSLMATWKFCQGGFFKDSKGHVMMMQKGQEKPKNLFLEHDAAWFQSCSTYCFTFIF